MKKKEIKTIKNYFWVHEERVFVYKDQYVARERRRTV
jgi:hypothetical protein